MLRSWVFGKETYQHTLQLKKKKSQSLYLQLEPYYFLPWNLWAREIKCECYLHGWGKECNGLSITVWKNPSHLTCYFLSHFQAHMGSSTNQGMAGHFFVPILQLSVSLGQVSAEQQKWQRCKQLVLPNVNWTWKPILDIRLPGWWAWTPLAALLMYIENFPFAPLVLSFFFLWRGGLSGDPSRADESGSVFCGAKDE